MNTRIKGKRYEPDEEMLATLNAKLGKLDKFFPNGARADVLLERAVGSQKKGDIWRAELIVVDGKKRYIAESTKAKLENAVTTVLRDVVDELARAHKKAIAGCRKVARSKKPR